MTLSDKPGPDTYSGSYYKGTYGDTGLKQYSSHWWPVRWYASMIERTLEDIGGNRVLEIGCGHGFILGRLEQKHETYGIDISTYAIEQTARFSPGSICATGNIEDGIPPELEHGSFDVVVSKYVFEHLRDPLQAMKFTAELLRPGGILLISVPNTESLGAKRKGTSWFAHPETDPTHISLFSPDKWLRTVDESGLEFCNETADGYWDFPYFNWLPDWAHPAIFLGPTALACLSGRAILPARFGENLVIFARKKSPAS
jgi:SAM-dependent methyltransferase